MVGMVYSRNTCLREVSLFDLFDRIVFFQILDVRADIPSLLHMLSYLLYSSILSAASLCTQRLWVKGECNVSDMSVVQYYHITPGGTIVPVTKSETDNAIRCQNIPSVLLVVYTEKYCSARSCFLCDMWCVATSNSLYNSCCLPRLERRSRCFSREYMRKTEKQTFLPQSQLKAPEAPTATNYWFVSHNPQSSENYAQRASHCINSGLRRRHTCLLYTSPSPRD